MSSPTGGGAGRERPASQFVVGIDLGTTNCALAYAELTPIGEEQGVEIRLLEVPQLTAPGTIEPRTLLPSFLYLTSEEERGQASLRLPWQNGEVGAVVGQFARRRAAELPDRVVSSAKSWLCNSGIDRAAEILPWAPAGAEVAGARKVSPVAAATAYLEHLRDAWNAALGPGADGARLEQQEIYLTVPASFDAAARDLTIEAAAAAGLERVVLLEEPQAAFYAWVEAMGDHWRERVRVGDLVLVCDVGGGTTDFSLIQVAEEAGELTLRRVAVGDHLLLGGDNMDLALAFSVRERLSRQGTKLDAWQFRSLVQGCRDAKERLLGDSPPESFPVVILGRGKKLIGGTLKVEIERTDVEARLLDGFFPAVAVDARPEAAAQSGLLEMGLTYASDPAVSRHLAAFLAAHRDALEDSNAGLPTGLLFNGGVMHSAALRSRVTQVLGRWASELAVRSAEPLDGADMEHAVARGAAYYGCARRGRGVRIRGGTARAYYVGVASAMPAVPGAPPPVKALCVVPFGIEEGTEIPVPGAEFGLLVGQPSSFRFFASSTRRDDLPGTLLDEWETEELEELSPLEVELAVEDSLGTESSRRVPVRLAAHVTEIGTLELWFLAREGQGRWRLEFSVRETSAVAA